MKKKNVLLVVAVVLGLVVLAAELLARTATSGSLSGLTVSGDLSVGTGGMIRSGATAYGSGVGWIAEFNGGTPRFRVGDPSGNRLEWNGTSLSVNGSITSSTGTIGGWTIGSTALTGGATSLDSDGTVSAASGDVKLDDDGLSLTPGTGTPNKLKWSSGAFLQSSGSDNLYVVGAPVMVRATSYFDVWVGGNTILTISSSGLDATALRLSGLGGYGNVFACVDNDGDIYQSASPCATDPARTEVAALRSELSALRAELAQLRALLPTR